MAQMLRAPGIDTRVWFAVARVDDDEDAIRWAADGSEDGALGWLVDVTFQGGPLDQVGPVVCRWAQDGLQINPVARGCLVVVAIQDGSPNVEPKIIGTVYAGDCPPPTAVNGSELVETDAQGDQVALDATHVVVSPHALDEEYAGDIRRRTPKTHRVLGALVELADQDATQSYMRGEDKADADEDLADAINTYQGQVLAAMTAMLPPGPPVTPVTQAQVTAGIAIITPAGVALSNAVAAHKAARTAYLSTKIKGE